MQIHLKQLEIEAALKMFIAQQGINLTGKTVEIAFTSGRKDNGLSAEITIEDQAGYVIPVSASLPIDTRTFEAKPVASIAVPEEASPEVTETAVVKSISLFSQ